MKKNAQLSLHRIDLHGPARARPVVLKQEDARVAIDEIGAPGFLPALLTPEGVLGPLLAYFTGKWQTRPRSWMNKVVRAVGLFVRYASAQPPDIDERVLMRGFADCLHTGTMDEDGRDPMGLGWHPAGDAAADRTIRTLARFFDFLAATGALNPAADEGWYGGLILRCAARWHADKTCLPLRRSTDGSARPGPGRFSKAAPQDQPAFPEDRLADLLFDGFRSSVGCDYRGMLITLLLNGAGLEVFEPFHLYVTDVVPEQGGPDRVSVLIHHPSQPGHAKAREPNPWVHDPARRAGYLRKRWSAGERANEDAAFLVSWSCADMEALFSTLWAHYRTQLASVSRDHPYAFVSLRGAARGRPYTVGQFNLAHAAACERIGLEVNRASGTTLEGHRLAYERRLQAGCLDAQLPQALRA